jgi:hypothetical protein
VAVFSGMLGVTLFGIFFTPVFYVVVRWMTSRGKSAAPAAAAADHGVPADAITNAQRDGVALEASHHDHETGT